MHITHIETLKISSRIKHTIFEKKTFKKIEKHTNISNKTEAEICAYIKTQIGNMNLETFNKICKIILNNFTLAIF